MPYFSEREEGECLRDDKEIAGPARAGVQVLIHTRIEDGSLGVRYPIRCREESYPIGTDKNLLWGAMGAEIPNLKECPWEVMPPRTLDILDTIEFCWRCIGKPIDCGYHGYLKHSHLKFDIEAGQEEFRKDINRIFRRQGIAYELVREGRIARLASTVLHEELVSAHFCTGDSELDQMLGTARRKFLDPHEATRREAVGFLWDAWERLKTLGLGLDKKAQVTALLDVTAGSSSPKFRRSLEQEAAELTWIGNNLQIRHSERNQERLAYDRHVDYVFHRLFSLIQVILRATSDQRRGHS